MVTRRPLFGSHSKDIQEFSIVLLGSPGVGKSALTVKYLTRRFIMEYDPDLEGTYHKTDTIDGQECHIKLVDTVETTSSKRLDGHIRSASGLVYVYSITSRESFVTAQRLLEKITQYGGAGGGAESGGGPVARELPIVLVANKTDLERFREVPRSEGAELAAAYDCLFHESSAADDYRSVQRVFHDLVREIRGGGGGGGSHYPQQDTLQPLFISEDGGKGFAGGAAGAMHKKGKSTTNLEVKSVDKEGPRFVQKRIPSTFKLFNKRFNIFN